MLFCSRNTRFFLSSSVMDIDHFHHYRGYKIKCLPAVTQQSLDRLCLQHHTFFQLSPMSTQHTHPQNYHRGGSLFHVKKIKIKKTQQNTKMFWSQWVKLVLSLFMFPVFGRFLSLELATKHRSWVRQKSLGNRDQSQGQKKSLYKESSNTSITAWSRMDSPNSSTQTSPWLWAESGPGPRHREFHPDGSRPEAAVCLGQGGPEEQR